MFNFFFLLVNTPYYTSVYTKKLHAPARGVSTSQGRGGLATKSIFFVNLPLSRFKSSFNIKIIFVLIESCRERVGPR